MSALARRLDVSLRPDPSRVVAELFVAGQEPVGPGASRASGVVARVLALDEDEVHRQLDDLRARFEERHRDLVATFSHHADRIADRLDPDADLSPERWLLLGATFTHEYAIEAAALCNPSMVEHPDQTTAPLGSLRFVMSVRGIGEGHRSSIGFRTGTVDAGGEVTIDDPGPFPTAATIGPLPFHVDDTFGGGEFQSRLTAPSELRDIAASSYSARFPAESALSERVLLPATVLEARGVEDARFVRFVDDDGSATYLATYTAFDGTAIGQQLLRTDDFVTFAASPMGGPAATNKGLALFPRRVHGRFAALSRADRETNAVAFSDSLGRWDHAETFQSPSRPWDLIQLGNCGSPIETDEGWLVLTHGVGPMRTYAIGALLLDLDDPTTVVRVLDEPLLTPGDDRDGYVPNVVYTCGALLHGDTLVLPYGIADTAIGVAAVPLPALLDAMVRPATSG